MGFRQRLEDIEIDHNQVDTPAGIYEHALLKMDNNKVTLIALPPLRFVSCSRTNKTLWYLLRARCCRDNAAIHSIGHPPPHFLAS